MLKSVLIANRGEIARRVIRTCNRLGVRTIAVYSDADSKSLHVREADEAIHIGASPAIESYLRGDRIIAAAKQTDAESIHPGYGFLSENADFAQAVLDAGLVWIGPKPDSIRAMGLKDAAKTLMAQAGVPTTPGYLGDDQSEARLQKEADAIGYPVLIKAVAGGGGKGMRKVENKAEFKAALQAAKREAASAFGDDRVLLEMYVTRPRHIEVQVFGDAHGNIVHLFERDCSLQRRHQKVIEEAPAPGMNEATRKAVTEAAVLAARAVNYVNAGTIEFIADASEGLRADRIWFMEMNTRLQVEHPVTEAITGQDLVEWQLRVASGEKLPLKQKDLKINGHAIEARLYAEDPGAGFLPSIGRLEVLRFGEADGGRVDAGVRQGDEVSPFYDPMIAKLIAHGDTRENALATLHDMASQTAAWPVKTNAAFLVRALAHPEFVAGAVDTGLIAREVDTLTAAPTPSESALMQAASELTRNSERPGFRLNAPHRVHALFLLDGEPVEIALSRHAAKASREAALLTEAGHAWRLTPWRKDSSSGAAAGDGAIRAPMPGKVIAVMVSEGQTVAAGDKLLTLEAMKMEHTLLAPFDGVVASVNASAGALVQVDALLVQIEQERH